MVGATAMSDSISVISWDSLHDIDPYEDETPWYQPSVHNQEHGFLVEETWFARLDADLSNIRSNIQEILGKSRNAQQLGQVPKNVEYDGEYRRGGSGDLHGNRSPDGINIGKDTICRDELRQVFSAEFRNSHIRHRIVHSIYARDSPYERSDDEVDRSLQRPFHGGIFIVGYHGEHYHVIHDCSWGTACCRCARIQDFEQRRGGRKSRYNRKITSSSSWTIEHWINLLLYLDSAERRIGAIEISGKWWLRCYRDKCRTLFQGSSFRLERGLESLRFSHEIDSTVPTGPYSYPGDEVDTEYYGALENTRGLQEDNVSCASGSSKGSGRGTTTRSQRSTEVVAQKTSLLQYLQRVIFSPPKALFTSRLWLKSKYRYVDRRKTYFNITFEELKLFYVEKSVSDIFTHTLHCDPCQIFYAAENVSDYYFSISDSVKYLESLLMFQTVNNEHAVANFLRDLYDILDKKIAKTNTLLIVGEPNSGKNYFFDAVCHFMINFGVIANWNRHNSFPLQDCLNRRLLFWNEPNFEDGVEETLKMLFGGDQCPARVKYEGDGIIQRTPIIVLSNSDCFPKNLAFRTRIIKYNWISCPHLKSLTKKPHPLAIGYLLSRWNIISWEALEYDFTDNEKTVIIGEPE